MRYPWKGVTVQPPKEIKMFNVLKGIASVAVKTVALPVTLAADVVTLGGSLNRHPSEGTYTGDLLGSMGRDIEDMSE
jgi:hypothetical protein